MKKIILTLAFLLVQLAVFAQAPAVEWKKCAGGTLMEQATTMQTTTDGGSIVAGFTTSSNGDVTSYHGGTDAWVVKLSATGAVEWQNSLGGTAYDTALSIQNTTDGGYIMAGYVVSTDGDVSGNHGSADAWVVKLSSSGTILWKKCYGGTGYDAIQNIQLDPNGGYILAGYSSSNNGDVSGNHSGSVDYWVAKISATGVLEWQKSLGGTGSDYATCIKPISGGGYIVTGYSESNNGDVSGNHGGIWDYWVVKLSSTGTIVWQKALGGTGADTATNVLSNSDGSFLVLGYSSSNNGNVSGNHGGQDVWIVKLSSTGSIDWQKSYGGTFTEYGNDIQKTTDGGYVFVGYTGSSDGDIVTYNHIGVETWVVKLDALGTIEWSNTFGGTADDFGKSIQTTADGGFIFAGYTSSSQTVASDGDVAANNGQTDIWVVKLKMAVATPTATSNQTFCNGSKVADLVATGTSLQWYAAETGGTALTPSTVLTETTYYVSQTVNGLESARTAVAVTLNTTPAPTASAQTLCNGFTVADLVASGTDLKWYEFPTNGTALTTSTTAVTGNYYVTQTINGCESTRTSVPVTIITTAIPTAISTQVYVGTATLAQLTVSGTAVQWYAASTGGSALANSTPLVDGTTYYASQTVYPCESFRIAVTVKKIGEASQSICSQATATVDTLASTPTTGATVQWFTAATGGTPLAAGTALTTGTYYVNQIINEIMVSTFAGGDYGNLDATGTAAQFAYPLGIATDPSGNIYVADADNSTIRKITPAGVVTTLAGSGSAGFADGTGSAADFNYPTSVAADGFGNVYVADTFNHRIRKITAAGVVTTLAGSGTAGAANGTGTAAQFNEPHGVGTDAAGNVYVADTKNNRIRKITLTGVVTTLAGSTAGFAEGIGTAAKFYRPMAVAADATGNVYVADTNHNIRKITPAGVVSTLAGGTTGNNAGFADGIGTSARFNVPFGVATDAAGNVYVADQGNHRIRKITAAGVVTTLAGTGTLGVANGLGNTAEFYSPNGVATDAAGNVYVIQAENNIVRKITQSTVSNRVAVAVNTTAVPTASAQTFCGSKTVSDLVAVGTNLKWYDVAANGTALASSTAISTGTYYVSQTLNGCESALTAVVVSVSSTPPIASNTYYVTSNTQIADLFGYDSIYKVYTSATVPSALPQTNMLTNGNYFATQTLNGCESTRTPITIVTYAAPSITSPTCGSVLTAISAPISATPVTNATGYAFEVTGNGSTRTFYTNTNSFNFTQLLGTTAYNTAYSIRVAAGFGLQYGNYGSACTLTTPAIANATQVISSMCGAALSSMTTPIYCGQIVGAQAYRFEFATGGISKNIDSATNSVQISNLTGGAIYSTAYSVRVAAKVAGVWQDFGYPCTVTTPAPSTQIRTNQCGTTLATKWTILNCGAITGATAYRFEWSNGGTVLTYTSSTSNMQLGNYTGWAINTIYSVRVAVQFGGTWQAYGTACNVKSPALARFISEEAAALTIKAIPNPFETEYVLMAQGGNQTPLQVLVYDMLGKQVEQFSVEANELENHSLGTNYSSGIYNVMISQGDEQQVVRIIKK